MRIVCESENGKQIEFAWKRPIWLLKAEGLSEIEFDVNTSSDDGQDGGNYEGSSAKSRNVVISAQITDNPVDTRNRLYQVFQPRSKGTLYYYEMDVKRKAYYYVESVSASLSGVTKSCVVSLICPDPMLYDSEDERIILATWAPKIKFPFVFHTPFQTSEYVNSLIGHVYNPSDTVHGMTIRFEAIGTVSNPSLYDVNRRSILKANLELTSGDVLTITTERGNKRILLEKDGVTEDKSDCMDFYSEWLQVYGGDNVYRYNADVGIDMLRVSVTHSQSYWGV